MGQPKPVSSRRLPVKLAIARWTMSGFLPAFQAITASTANSGRVWISARIASARPCDIRNSAASAAHATTNAAPIIAGNVHVADHAEPGTTCSVPAARPRRSRIFTARGYSMAAMPAIASASNPRIREIARSLEAHTHFLLEGEKAILDAVSAGHRLEHVLHDESVRPGRLAAICAVGPPLVLPPGVQRPAQVQAAAA